MKTESQFVKQFAGHAVIDLNRPSAELTAALDAAGVELADVRQIAGVDGQIKGKRELGKLFALVDGLDPNTQDKRVHFTDKNGNLNAAGSLNAAFLDEAKRNRAKPQYKQPGSEGASPQPRLTAANDGLVVDERVRLGEVTLGVKKQTQRDYAKEAGLPNPGTACRATAQHGIESFLKETQASPPRLAPLDQAIQVGYAEDDKGRLAVDTTQAVIALEYIDRCLDAGYPLLVGVSWHDAGGGSNADNLTDHWVSITGRGYDDAGRVYYTFNDPADGREGRFYVDQLTGKLFREGDPAGKKWRHKDYQVTQVRTYRGVG